MACFLPGRGRFFPRRDLGQVVGNPRKEKIRSPTTDVAKKINLIGVFELGTGNFYGELEEESVNGMRFKEFILSLKKRREGDKNHPDL